jgi:integrase
VGRNPDTPLYNIAMLRLLERMGRSDLTVHGFRSTFHDWAAERTSFSNEVVEMALAHAVDDKTEAAYRRGDLFEKRRRMDTWAEFCARPAERGEKHLRRPSNLAEAR